MTKKEKENLISELNQKMHDLWMYDDNFGTAAAELMITTLNALAKSYDVAFKADISMLETMSGRKAYQEEEESSDEEYWEEPEEASDTL